MTVRHAQLLTDRALLALAGGVLLIVAACSGSSAGSDGSDGTSDSFVVTVRQAVAAVEASLGGQQEFFEVTATPQLTNVFVATNDATSAVPYVYLDGELQPPGPVIEGVQGQTFVASALDFDESSILAGVSTDLPDSTIDSFSVEGGPGGFVRYIISARSNQGGVLDIVVAPGGAVIEVNPL